MKIIVADLKTIYSNEQSIPQQLNELRSPMAGTKANSLALASSPTGTACVKTEISAKDIFLV